MAAMEIRKQVQHWRHQRKRYLARHFLETLNYYNNQRILIVWRLLNNTSFSSYFHRAVHMDHVRESSQKKYTGSINFIRRELASFLMEPVFLGLQLQHVDACWQVWFQNCVWKNPIRMFWSQSDQRYGNKQNLGVWK